MKFLFIFLTVVYSSMIFANDDATNKVRLSLWYDGIEKDAQKSDLKEEVTSLDKKKVYIPEELVKALDRI